MNMLQSEQSFA